MNFWHLPMFDSSCFKANTGLVYYPKIKLQFQNSREPEGIFKRHIFKGSFKTWMSRSHELIFLRNNESCFRLKDRSASAKKIFARLKISYKSNNLNEKKIILMIFCPTLFISSFTHLKQPPVRLRMYDFSPSNQSHPASKTVTQFSKQSSEHIL